MHAVICLEIESNETQSDVLRQLRHVDARYQAYSWLSEVWHSSC